MSATKDHPHPCGEKLSYVAIKRFISGSPPPMWGKAFQFQAYPLLLWITPTHVGKRRYSKEEYLRGWDHPHPCGEKHSRSCYTDRKTGSPPPMWGKVLRECWKKSKPRITPTHVGKSTFWLSTVSPIWDHPHPCGEKAVFPNS